MILLVKLAGFCRTPSDAALSYYHFLANWIFSGEKISAEQLIELVYLKYGAPKTETETASQFHHISKHHLPEE